MEYQRFLQQNQKQAKEKGATAIEERRYLNVIDELEVLQSQQAEQAQAGAGAGAASAATASDFFLAPLRKKLLHSLREFLIELTTHASVLPIPLKEDASQSLSSELHKYLKYHGSTVLREFVVAPADLDDSLQDVRRNIAQALDKTYAHIRASIKAHDLETKYRNVLRLLSPCLEPAEQARFASLLGEVPARRRDKCRASSTSSRSAVWPIFSASHPAICTPVC